MKFVPKPPCNFDIYVDRPGTVYAEREAGDSLEILYAEGYLPYSGAQGLRDVFYNARSARVMLNEFSITSENRRIAKKFDGQFKKERVPFSQFSPTEDFYEFCLGYFAQHHGPQAMPRGRLTTILYSGLITSVLIYRSTHTPAAYVLEVEDGMMGHFWFSFYDLSYTKQSLGLWLMLDCIRSAKERGLSNYYLGTVYDESARYKLNFKPLEWWDGNSWSRDTERLKHL